MSKFNRVVWSEGMFLGPHHFQQWDRFSQSELDFVQSGIRPHSWGARSIEIDVEALSNSRFNLTGIDAVLPDGTLVRAPLADPLPPSRQFAEFFGAELPVLPVYLALPDIRTGVPLCQEVGQESSLTSRYIGENRDLPDFNRPGQETEVLVAKQNLKLLFGGENLEGYIAIKVAEIERNNDGLPVLRRDYAVPSLSLRAAGPVGGIVRSLLETMSTKSTALAAQTRQRDGAMIEFTSSDVGSFWLLHTVNSYIPQLAHYQANQDTHPLELYFCLAQLAGSLCTFGVDRHPRDVAPYDHEHLGETFRSLEKHIRELLSSVMPSRYLGVVLQQQTETMLTGDIVEERLLQPGVAWFLSVSGDMPEGRIRDEVPQQIIIGTPHNVDFLVRTATPGVLFTHVPVPPRDFPLKTGHVYFQLDAAGEAWSTVQDARAIAIYIGGPELRDLQFELISMN